MLSYLLTRAHVAYIHISIHGDTLSHSQNGSGHQNPSPHPPTKALTANPSNPLNPPYTANGYPPL